MPKTHDSYRFRTIGSCVTHGSYCNNWERYQGCPTCVQMATYKNAGRTLVGLVWPDTLRGINPSAALRQDMRDLYARCEREIYEQTDPRT